MQEPHVSQVTLSFSFNANRALQSKASISSLSHPHDIKLWLPTFPLQFASITLAAMKLLVFIGFLALGILSLRGMRWAYITFVLLGLLYFPVSVGFRMNPRPCEVAVNLPLAIHSLTNYRHIVLFVLFFFMTSAQFRMSRWQGYVWSAVACLTMGLLVELAEGISGNHHCRMRDLIPDAAGVLIGAGIVFLWNTVRGRRRVT